MKAFNVSESETQSNIFSYNVEANHIFEIQNRSCTEHNRTFNKKKKQIDLTLENVSTIKKMLVRDIEKKKKNKKTNSEEYKRE